MPGNENSKRKEMAIKRLPFVEEHLPFAGQLQICYHGRVHRQEESVSKIRVRQVLSRVRLVIVDFVLHNHQASLPECNRFGSRVLRNLR